jgi:hypothetical protein
MFGYPDAFLWTVALYALLLNALWEIVHLNLLYTCWDRWTLREGLLWMTGAIFGDVVLVLGLLLLTTLLMGAEHILAPTIPGLGVLTGLSFAVSIVCEWVARWVNLWKHYKPSMPTVRIAGQLVGISPIAQITLLPLASTLLALITVGS